MIQTAVLSKAEKKRLSKDGFLTLSGFVDPEELAVIRRVFDHLFETNAGWEDGNKFDLAGTDDSGPPKLPQILKPSRYAPELLDLKVVQRVREITMDYFACESVEMGEHMILKPPYRGEVTPWHQDQAYHDPAMDERSMNFWMPLDATDEANGCMQYVPGSHKLDVLPHHSIGDDPRIHGLEVDSPEQLAKNVVACPMNAGDAVIHLPTTLHFAGRNSTPRRRRAYIVSMVAPGQPRSTPVDNYWMREKRTSRLERAAASNSPP